MILSNLTEFCSLPVFCLVCAVLGAVMLPLHCCVILAGLVLIANVPLYFKRRRKIWAIAFAYGSGWFALNFDFVRTSFDNHPNLVNVSGFLWITLAVMGGGFGIGVISAYVTLMRLTNTSSFALPLSVVSGELIVDMLVQTTAATTGFPITLAHRFVDCTVLCQTASLGGVPLVSWTVAMIAGLMADSCRALSGECWSIRSMLLSVGITLCNLTFGLACVNFPVESHDYCLIVPHKFLSNDTKSLCKLMDHFRPRPMLAIWPETALEPTVESASGKFCHGRQMIDQMAVDLGCTTVVGVTRTDPQSAGPFNSAVVCSSRNSTRPVEEIRYYDKQYLAPVIEMGVPPFRPFPLLASTSTIPYLRGNRANSAFDFHFGDPTRRNESRNTFGIGICHDLCFSQWGADWMKQKPLPDFFVHIANESFDRNWKAQGMLLASARFRAIETRRSIIRCVDGGYSSMIDSSGRTVDLVTRHANNQPFVTSHIPFDHRRSVFSVLGPIRCVGVMTVMSLAMFFFHLNYELRA